MNCSSVAHDVHTGTVVLMSFHAYHSFLFHFPSVNLQIYLAQGQFASSHQRVISYFLSLSESEQDDFRDLIHSLLVCFPSKPNYADISAPYVGASCHL